MKLQWEKTLSCRHAPFTCRAFPPLPARLHRPCVRANQNSGKLHHRTCYIVSVQRKIFAAFCYLVAKPPTSLLSFVAHDVAYDFTFMSHLITIAGKIWGAEEENAAQVRRLISRDRKEFLGNSEGDILEKYKVELGDVPSEPSSSEGPIVGASKRFGVRKPLSDWGRTR